MTFGAAFVQAPSALKRALVAWVVVGVVPSLWLIARYLVTPGSGAYVAAYTTYVAVFGALFWFVFHRRHGARVAAIVLSLVVMVLAGSATAMMVFIRFGASVFSDPPVALALFMPVMHVYVAWELTRGSVEAYARPAPHRAHPHPVPQTASLKQTPLPPAAATRECAACGARTPVGAERCVECGSAL